MFCYRLSPSSFLLYLFFFIYFTSYLKLISHLASIILFFLILSYFILSYLQSISGRSTMNLGILFFPFIGRVLTQCYKYAHHQKYHHKTCPTNALQNVSQKEQRKHKNKIGDKKKIGQKRCFLKKFSWHLFWSIFSLSPILFLCFLFSFCDTFCSAFVGQVLWWFSWWCAYL